MKRSELKVGEIYAHEHGYRNVIPVRILDASQAYVNVARYRSDEKYTPDIRPANEQITRTVEERTGYGRAAEVVTRERTKPAKDWVQGLPGVKVELLDSQTLEVRQIGVVESRYIKRTWAAYTEANNADLQRKQEIQAKVARMNRRLDEAGVVAVQKVTYGTVSLSYDEMDRLLDRIVSA